MFDDEKVGNESVNGEDVNQDSPEGNNVEEEKIVEARPSGTLQETSRGFTCFLLVMLALFILIIVLGMVGIRISFP